METKCVIQQKITDHLNCNLSILCLHLFTYSTLMIKHDSKDIKEYLSLLFGFKELREKGLKAISHSHAREEVFKLMD